MQIVPEAKHLNIYACQNQASRSTHGITSSSQNERVALHIKFHVNSFFPQNVKHPELLLGLFELQQLTSDPTAATTMANVSLFR